MIGLSRTSTTKEIIDKTDENTAIRYKVINEQIDLEVLKKEKENLEEQLKSKEPSDKELIAFGKSNHLYYTGTRYAHDRIVEINSLLNA